MPHPRSFLKSFGLNASAFMDLVKILGDTNALIFLELAKILGVKLILNNFFLSIQC